MLSIGVIE